LLGNVAAASCASAVAAKRNVAEINTGSARTLFSLPARNYATRASF
jgi:hypothetical protein